MSARALHGQFESAISLSVQQYKAVNSTVLRMKNGAVGWQCISTVSTAKLGVPRQSCHHQVLVSYNATMQLLPVHECSAASLQECVCNEPTQSVPSLLNLLMPAYNLQHNQTHLSESWHI